MTAIAGFLALTAVSAALAQTIDGLDLKAVKARGTEATADAQTLVDAVVLMRIANDKSQGAGEKLVDLLGQLTGAIDSRDLVTAADIVDFDLRDLLKEL
ncbi:MAG TPA: hypothetical protein PKC74_08105 [Turneriella sp.]|nr:hypothetical protein [Turneriella sp.]